MRRHLINAEKLGTKKDDIFEVFRKRGRKKDFNYLTENIFDPYYPSKGLRQKFEEITPPGKVNPFPQAEPVLDRMFEAFSKKNLSDPDFGFKLEDFLPKQQPSLDQGRVQPTPQPNPAVVTPPVQPAVAAQSGLTPTEEALLSPSEKAIRLRQRGLG